MKWLNSKFICCLLFLMASSISSIRAQWRSFGESKVGNLIFDLYAKKGSWGMGQQFFGANVKSNFSMKVRVEGELVAHLTCGNEAISKLDFKIESQQLIYKVDPSDTTNIGAGWFAENKGLLGDAPEELCKGNEIIIRGHKSRNRISSLQVRKLKFFTKGEDGEEIEVSSQGVPLNPKKDSKNQSSTKSEELDKTGSGEQKENDQLEQYRKAEEQRIKQENTTQQNLARTQEELRKRDEAKRAEEKEKQARVAANTAAVTAGFMALGGSILGADIAPKFCDSPSFLLEGNFGFMGSSVPALENVYSFRKQDFKDYSQSETMLGLGLSANVKVWPYRSLNFGIAGTGSIFYHLPMWEDGVELFSYSLGGRSVIGHEFVKAVVDLGITHRIGSSTLSSDQTTIFSNGTYAINTVFTEQKFNYLSNKLGLGLMIEYDAEEGEQVYYTFMVTREMLNFVKTKQPYYSFKAEIRCLLDLEIEYAQNYPIAGLPGYAYKQDGRNKDFFQVSFGIPMGLLVNY
jgi:hypothetical protein